MYITKKERASIHSAIDIISNLISSINPTESKECANSIKNLNETIDGLHSIIGKSQEDYSRRKIREKVKSLSNLMK
jgi:hypothetical protein